ncbi:DUF4337 domain-containing protein [Sulfurimonas sp.]|uniref:DUF4337 domain-containing protein n=1 Tax=Sulfurimonas sp. TaxID=2022749 RepID=UPI0025D06960|nr:DUF4337 domain-containing protein [Sulfurimonas sp.]
MSGHGFHVHGAHDHAVEAEHESSLGQYIAIFTAILASIGAIVSYQGGDSQNKAMLLKNEAVFLKTQASDQWNFYQAKSSKLHLMELATDVAPKEKQEFYKQQKGKYEQEKQAIKKKAEALDAESAKTNKLSDEAMISHHHLAQSMTLIQIAISLASITVLTRKKWLFAIAAIAAVGGIVLWAEALL